MIIKEVDDKTQIIKTLKGLLYHPKLFDSVKEKLKREIYMIEKGWENEKKAAYYINHYYKDAKYNYVLHDLRLKVGNYSVQIDHLILGKVRNLILESKYFSSELIYSNDVFSIRTKRGIKGIPDPRLQAERQIDNLKEIAKTVGIKDLISSTFDYYVILSPEVYIKKLPEKVIKADAIMKQIVKDTDEANAVKVLKGFFSLLTTDSSSIREAAHALVSYHKPYDASMYLKKLGIEWVLQDK